MAMLPFCGYNMADYWQHWLDMGEKGGDKMPKIFHVNWFRKDADDNWLWPGFGTNIRVLEWITKRSRGEGEAEETPIGYLPTAEALNMNGLGVSDAAQQELLKVDPQDWRAEVEDREQYFQQFGEKLPAAIKAENDRLKAKLG